MIKIQWDRAGTIFVISHLERDGLSIALALARWLLLYGGANSCCGSISYIRGVRNNGSNNTKIKAPALRRTRNIWRTCRCSFSFCCISLPLLYLSEGNIYAVSDYGNVISCCGQYIRERRGGREGVAEELLKNPLFYLRRYISRESFFGGLLFENAFPLPSTH